jgi:hypothetical protein
MKIFPSTQSKRKRAQRGVFLVLMIVLLPVFIYLLMLVFDLGKRFIISRQAQNLADLSINAAVVMLLKEDPSDVASVSKTNYTNMKPLVSNLIGISQIFTSAQLSGYTFNAGASTSYPHEVAGHATDTLAASQAGRSTVRVTLRRKVSCFNALGQEQIIDLDDSSTHWCLANYVTASVTVSNNLPFFARFMGITDLGDVTRDASAQIRPRGDACGKPLCSAFTPYLIANGNTWSIDPLNPPLCKYPIIIPAPLPTP